MAFHKSLITIFLVFLFIHASNAQLGGLTEIEDVEHNKEVQDLGRYSVEEHNKKLGNSNLRLVFSEVVSAEKQIVSGTKYYLKIEAKEKGVKKLFQSQVVVQPWVKKAPRIMLGFAPFTGY
uniref:Cystatin domain-containing protein n=1 Tax=Kalanchoe fedtschenkoi TaxID=63787 RepID=A0A7N0VCY8_KALFE